MWAHYLITDLQTVGIAYIQRPMLLSLVISASYLMFDRTLFSEVRMQTFDHFVTTSKHVLLSFDDPISQIVNSE